MIPHVQQDENKVTVKLIGKMDSATSAAIEQHLNDILKELGSRHLCFDLKEVTFLASAFLRLCMVAAKKAGKGMFAITGTSPEIKKVLHIAAFDQIANIS